MTSRLIEYLKALPLPDAVKLFFHVKNKNYTPIKLSILKHPVFLRGIKSDKVMFEQIFIEEDYNIHFPITPTNIIDAGANVGYASVFFANKFPDATIFAIEPEENNFKLAQKNTSFYPNVQLHQGALWYRKTHLNIIDKGLGEAAFMIEEGEGNNLTAFTIDGIMALLKIDSIDLLKIDIEGAEKELFDTGYETWLPKTKILIVETHDRYKKGTSKALFTAISQYDFSFEVSGENLVFYNNLLLADTPIYK